MGPRRYRLLQSRSSEAAKALAMAAAEVRSPSLVAERTRAVTEVAESPSAEAGTQSAAAGSQSVEAAGTRIRKPQELPLGPCYHIGGQFVSSYLGSYQPIYWAVPRTEGTGSSVDFPENC